MKKNPARNTFLEKDSSKLLLKINNSIDIDSRLYREDCEKINSICYKKIFMKHLNKLIALFLLSILWACGKVGPLSLPEDKLDKSIITYPCDEACMKKFEEEKKRQKLVIIQTD